MINEQPFFKRLKSALDVADSMEIDFGDLQVALEQLKLLDGYTRVNQWVSVSEPPEVGTRVVAALFAHGDAEHGGMDVIFWDEDSVELGYSHWLPTTALPTPPGEIDE